MPEDLEELISEAICIDNLQRRFAALSRQTPKPYDRLPISEHRLRTSSNVNSGRRLTEQQREHRRKNNLCMYCGAEGHIIRNCPTLSKGPPRSARIFETTLAANESLGNEPTQLM